MFIRKIKGKIKGIVKGIPIKGKGIINKNTSTHEGVQKKVCQIFQGISAFWKNKNGKIYRKSSQKITGRYYRIITGGSIRRKKLRGSITENYREISAPELQQKSYKYLTNGNYGG